MFLTTGRRNLAVFAADARHRFLVRAVDPPDGPVPPRMTLIRDRGPYTVAGESALLREHRIGLLVTKNSGGPMMAAKLAAARLPGGSACWCSWCGARRRRAARRWGRSARRLAGLV